MKQYKVGDEIKVYEILTCGDFKECHKGKQVACIADYGGGLIRIALKSRYKEDAHPDENLLYIKDKEAKHVCTMRITKLKK